MASSNSRALSHFRRSTHRSRSSLMCAGGPPKPMQPMRPHSRRMVARDTRGGSPLPGWLRPPGAVAPFAADHQTSAASALSAVMFD